MINGIQVLGGFAASCVIQMVCLFRSPLSNLISIYLTPYQPLIGLMQLLPTADLTTATSIVVFFQFLGGAIFLAIAENIFVSRLVTSLHVFAPSVDAQAVVKVGAAGLRSLLSEQGQLGLLGKALLAYDEAITRTFMLGAAGGAIAFVASAGMEWKGLGKLMGRKRGL